MNQLHASRVLWTLSLVLITFSVTGRTIDVEAVKDDATPVLNRVLEEIAEESSPVIIKLNPSEYHLYRKTSVNKLYHISNTASEKENPDQTKHIGLFFKNLKNVTLDGNGAKLITHGELTSFVIDSCENIAIKKFNHNGC